MKANTGGIIQLQLLEVNWSCLHKVARVLNQPSLNLLSPNNQIHISHHIEYCKWKFEQFVS